jgi:TetR/AcrR family transcriptional regulator, mexJK operon transcriptional repressor
VVHMSHCVRSKKCTGKHVVDSTITADLFLSLVIGCQTRMAMLSIETDPEQVDQRVQAAVKLFLDGVRPRAKG